MLDTYQVGDVRITRIHEYSGPTHDPRFLLPDMTPEQLAAQRDWMAPDHWVPAMNKLVLTVQLWLVHAGDQIIVVDTGVGNGKPREGMARMNRLNTLVLEWLEAAGAPADKVTHVVNTHLHMDHVGWNTRWLDNRWTPTFPNARYYLPKDDFLFCMEGKNKEQPLDVFGAAIEDSVKPLAAEAMIELIGPGDEIAGCMVVEDASGHSPGQVAFRVHSRGEQALFCGDVFHNPMQIVYPDLNSGYCIWADKARQTRRAMLEDLAQSGALLLPVHFGQPYAGYVRREQGGYRFEAAGSQS